MSSYLASRRLIVLKGFLFLLLLVLASALVLMECPSWKVAGLLVLVVWSAGRWSFFTTYVLQTYVDPAYRHDGIVSLLLWLGRRRR